METSEPRHAALVTFFYDGIPVGSFEDGLIPAEPGIYRYMPYRSVGNYLMGKAVEAGEKPVCHYVVDGIRTQFVVVARGRTPDVQLDMFTRIAE